MSTRHATQQVNPFLTVPIGRLFLLNALPMTVVMSMGGVLNIVDGVFVGHFIGSDALAAVSLAFPVAMVLSALSTLTGGGMSSLMARHLGAGDRITAGRVFAETHGLVLAISVGLVVLWEVVGTTLIGSMAAGNSKIAELAQDYLRIIILGAPVQLMLGIHADALRSEGQAGLIATLSVLINLFNIGANWLGIVVLGLGVSGSALGTVAAQALGLVLVLGVRRYSKRLLPLSVLRTQSWLGAWLEIIRLGLPLCLSFIGIAVVASTVMLFLRLHAGAEYGALVAAYGVVTRLLSFAFLPQMAIALATQSITGNNVGAGRNDRALATLRLAMSVAFLWCMSVALIGTVAGTTLGSWFSYDPAVIDAVTEILRPMMLLYVSSGPILVLALYFQSLGQSGRTAALTLVKPWLLTPLFILTLSAGFGVRGIWIAFPLAEAIMLIIAVLIARNVLSTTGTQAFNAEEHR
ncbi:MATE family efflux transporter [Pseudochrobactrum sp. sp1633]|uniref:MATE family efflux transporter n=1 Tax=Pseudochrobactrum sp. sp1633 TaxID=3036706 RepID=UPI0025A5CA5A|nr:MATE family efflux transporter [Pseudochrobactrum sp. sp1633]MDM8343806.1 MATE family efflux transporter [Pseudochrobactrum sp. sp1633]